jgi:hypothetical protein
MMTREQMIDEVVRMFGFENKWTIWFCELAENESITDDSLLSALVALEAIDTVSYLEESEEE